MINVADVCRKTTAWKRVWNEDAIFSLHTQSTPGTPVYIEAVIDGISNSNGKIAAQLAVQTLYPAISNFVFPLLPGLAIAEDSSIGDQLSQALRSVILAVHQHLCDNSRRLGEDLGCTLSLAVLACNSVFTANVGDSPILLVTDPGVQELYCPQQQGGDLYTLEKWCGPPGDTLACQEDIPIHRIELDEDGILLLGTDGALARSAIAPETLFSVLQDAWKDNWTMEEMVDCICNYVDQSDSSDNLSMIALRYCIS